ncbi:GDSL esterase/lipase At3g26430-like [Prunus avium]|uniref:GDSL esterase/lipase At3g26430-like n=1 Tax=Prunus avium TaxID=42229 RepID=A0A6P5U0L8_PRUAV|nr:GDSL esterase/lipase At3g26430-like [Prunus avium]
METRFLLRLRDHHVLFGLVIWATLVLPSLSISVRSCSFPAMFNFGDSNSDTGGLSAAFGQAPYPNGETYFHTPSGRYSDGRLLIDFIAESLRLPHLSAFLDSVGSNFSHGANFATAGSTIRPPNTTISQSGVSPISLDVQLVQFLDFLTRSQIYKKKGEVFGKLLPKKEYFSQALYTFDIGQNDLTAGYKLNLTTEQVKAYVPDVLSQLSNTIKIVYEQGGRSFWIHNTGPLGCLPYVLDRFLINRAQIDKYGCADQFNEVAQYFNQRLKEALLHLKKDLPLAAITYVDVYSVKRALITQTKKYGFGNPLVACCGHGGKYNYNRYVKCGTKKTINGNETVIAKSCNDPTVRINWDGVHYTEAANKWIFQEIVNGSFSDPPKPLKMACLRNRMDH